MRWLGGLGPSCCVSARERMYAAASLVTFSETVPPFDSTGWAAPTFVPSAMAATGQPTRMNAPAEAARPPGGPTQQITGRVEPLIDLITDRSKLRHVSAS